MLLLAASEGRHWRYEVCEHSDGYLVQMRDLDTGELDNEFATVFRTMPVAFAYAEMSAAFDRFAAAENDEADDGEIAIDLELSERNFTDLSDRLHDVGISGGSLKSWDKVKSLPRITVH
jgi:DNA-binding transcriptional LysR family regulator